MALLGQILPLTREKTSGNGVVEIDLGKVNNEVIDASGGVGNGRVFSRTKSDQEVLIRDSIPAEAIRVIEEP